MAKFSGLIGYEIQVDKGKGVWVSEIVEKKAKGDFLNEVWRHNQASKIHDDITVTNRISLIADQYANANKMSMKYIVFDGVAWDISTVEVQRPRLIINAGGIYNGERPSTKATT